MDELKQKIAAQVTFCNDNEYPTFIPFDDVCFCCRWNIFTVYSLEHASCKLIMSCPHCKCLFCN